MNIKKLGWGFAIMVMALLQVWNATPAHAAGGFSGAIYTTTKSGEIVNANIFADCEDVYLNGGPQNSHANGLPNGVYFFQVTDPSGKTLLSKDNAADRMLLVANGVVSGKVGTHDNGDYNDANMSTPVRLWEFNETPNNGDEHKAWLIPVGAATIDDDDPRVLHFSDADAKTDNFKCRHHDLPPETVTISGLKYYDSAVNGVLDPGDLPVQGIKVSITLTDGVTSTTVVVTTNILGQWALEIPVGSAVSGMACEIAPPAQPTYSWVQTGPLVGATSGLDAVADSNKCWTFTVGNTNISGLDFGNVAIGAGGGLTLGFWSNKNGAKVITSPSNLLPTVLALNLRKANGAFLGNVSLADFQKFLTGASATNMANMLSAQLAAMDLNVLSYPSNPFSGGVNPSALIYAPGAASANVNGFTTVGALLTEANTELGLHGLALDGSPYRAYQEALKTALDKGNNNLTFVLAVPPIPPVLYP
jgi:hypothetical protein